MATTKKVVENTAYKLTIETDDGVTASPLQGDTTARQ